MKKIFIILLMCLLFTGCTSDINFKFNNDSIDVDLRGEFTLDDYYNYLKTNSPEYSNVQKSNDEIKKILEDNLKTISVPAFADAKEQFIQTDFKYTNDTDVTLQYKYQYNYETIKNNYIFKECFSYFDFKEDDKYYYYALSGDFNCNFDNLKLNVYAENGIYTSNSFEQKEGVHTWTPQKTDNDIYFVIYKNPGEEIKAPIFGVSAIFVVLFVVAMVAIFGLFIVYNNKNRGY